MSLLNTRLDCYNDITVHFGELLCELPVESAIVLMVIYDILEVTFFENFAIGNVYTDDDGYHHIEEGEVEHVLSCAIERVEKSLIFLQKNNYIFRVKINDTKYVGVNCNLLKSVFSGEA